MSLSDELVSQLVKATASTEKKQTESTVYGVIVKQDDIVYVKVDGSDGLTPVTTTADVSDGERVTVLIKDHMATITGNVSSPSAKNSSVQGLSSSFVEFKKVNTEQLTATNAEITNLWAKNAEIAGNITAHSATIEELKAKDVEITGSLTAQSAEIANIKATSLTAESADLKYATIDNLEVVRQDVFDLNATYGDFVDLTTKNFEAVDADIKNLDAKKATVDDLTAANGRIDTLETNSLTADSAVIKELQSDQAEFEEATAKNFEAVNADIVDLDAKYAEIENLDTKYANIDFSNIGQAAIEEFLSKSGLIENLVVGDGTITGNLVGVTIKGDLIEGNTIVADKLVVQGEDGLYYKLNTSAIVSGMRKNQYVKMDVVLDDVTGTIVKDVFTTTEEQVYKYTDSEGNVGYYCVVDSVCYQVVIEASETTLEQTEYNSLNGSIIAAKSITATQISVDDFVAFDATIGGFNITNHSLYSGVKESVNNTTRGIYLDADGQMAVGDSDSYIKYYRDADENYNLDIRAKRVTIGGSDVASSIDDLGNTVNTGLQANADRIEEVNNGLQGQFTSFYDKLLINDDGILISAGKNTMAIRLANGVITFEKGATLEKQGDVFGWWDGADFHTGNILIDVTERAQFGNFAFIPRTDGSLSFLKVSHNTGFYTRLVGGTMYVYGAYPVLEDTTLVISDISGELDGTTLILGGEE